MREWISALRLTGFVESCLLRGTCSGEHAYSAVDDLEVAAGVGRGDDWGLGGEEMADLALLEAAGGFGLGDVVDAGAAAAPLCLGAFAQLDAGQRAQDCPRLGAYFLAVAEVTGFVIRDRRGGGGGGRAVGFRKRISTRYSWMSRSFFDQAAARAA
jgi:hypothetical protein